MDPKIFARCQGFDWDQSNAIKNWKQHRVTQAECEQIFYNRPLVGGEDSPHSQTEPRYFLLGETDAGRRLFVVFTIRADLIQVISARDMNRRERKVFENAEEDESNPEI